MGKRPTKEEYHAIYSTIAKERGGRLLSFKYFGSDIKMDWECAEGHRWSATANNVQKGRWCPVCAGHSGGVSYKVAMPVIKENPPNIPDTSDETHKVKRPSSPAYFFHKYNTIAMERGGRLVSEAYTHSAVKLEWECAEGHRWEATPNNIQKGRWCPTCRGGVRKDGETKTHKRKPGPKRQKVVPKNSNEETMLDIGMTFGQWEHLNECRKLAHTRGGWLVSSTYEGAATPMVWECAIGHRWNSSKNNVKKGRWCPKCSGTFGHEPWEPSYLYRIECATDPDTYIGITNNTAWRLSEHRKRVDKVGHIARIGGMYVYTGYDIQNLLKQSTPSREIFEWLEGKTPDKEGWFVDDWRGTPAVPRFVVKWLETYLIRTTSSMEDGLENGVLLNIQENPTADKAKESLSQYH